MITDPERKKQTQRLCVCGDKADHFCGKVHPHADATERQCCWILCWLVVIGTLAAVGLVTLGGCR
jgi:hypothetical protein